MTLLSLEKKYFPKSTRKIIISLAFLLIKLIQSKFIDCYNYSKYKIPKVYVLENEKLALWKFDHILNIIFKIFYKTDLILNICLHNYNLNFN